MFEITAGIEDELVDGSNIPVEKVVDTGEKTFENELKKITERIYGKKTDEKPRPKVKAEAHVNPKLEKLKQNLEKTSAIDSRIYDEIHEVLKFRDVDEQIINVILKQMDKYKDFLDSENVDNYVVSTLSSLVSTSNFEVKKGSKPNIIALIGPTGVGKTTCIAKLAIISKILHNLDVGLISIDTYRLGALDQLKIFSEVSNIEFFVAYEPSDLASLVNKMRKKDIIFIDTVGRSQNSPAHLKGIQDFLSAVKTDDIFLVLSSTSTSKNLIDVAQKFKILNYSGLIFTKIDEAVTFGNILNITSKTDTPIKYLTNGQVIPDDIIAADPEFIANMVYSGKVNL